MKIKIFCDICKQHIAYADTEKLADPITPEMFESTMAERGLPPPFPSGIDWLDMRCPFGPYGESHRPFLYRDSFLTGITAEKGKRVEVRFKIGDPEPIDWDALPLQEANDLRMRDFFPPEAEPPLPIEPQEKPFVCECGQEYAHRSSLSRHKKTCPAAKTKKQGRKRG